MNKLIKDLLKEAHDHGFSVASSFLGWDAQKSFTEFLKQNNIPLVTEDEIRDQVAKKAKHMQAQGHTLRDIASTLGYNHPQTIKNMIYWYDKRQQKLTNPRPASVRRERSMTFKEGLFNRDDLTVMFGGPLSVDKNRFIAQAVKVPDFTYTYREREDAGGGCYYNNWVTTEVTEKNTYLIIHEGKVIGWMQPCHYYWRTYKSRLYPMNWKGTKKQVIDFAESLKVTN